MKFLPFSDDETMDIKHLNKYIAKHKRLNGSRYKKLKMDMKGSIQL